MFGISLSGLNASQKYLDTTSNNISNSNTYGFKKSRAEFADIYSNTIFSSSKTATGQGALTATVAQQFTQGSLTGDTGNNLDMAIEGNGFFVLAPSANPVDGNSQIEARTYTRNGAFELDNEGYVVTSGGDYLQFYDINPTTDAVTNLTMNGTHAVKIPTDTGAPKMSSKVSLGVNLPANDDSYDPTKFDPSDSATYNASTSETIHDSLGGAHTLTYYYIKDSTATDDRTWKVVCMVDGNTTDHLVDISDDQGNSLGTINVTNNPSSSVAGATIACATLHFDTSGRLDNNATGSNFVLLNNNSTPTTTGHALSVAMGGGVDDTQLVKVTMNATQYGSSSFTVSETPTDDGYSTGLLKNVSVNEDGILLATYSNGRNVHLAKVALADFINPQGLTKIGDTQWQESMASGQARPVQANVGTAGAIKGANLEQSNVDLSASLVDLIVAQRSYQANCQSLQTENTMMDAIMSVR